MGRLFNILRRRAAPAEPNLPATAAVSVDPKSASVLANGGCTMETLMSSAEYEDAREFDRPEELDQALKDIANLACAELEQQYLDRSTDWSLWSDKKNLKVELNKKCQSGSICGRGTYLWNDPPADMDMDFILQVMWDADTKKKYDENTDKMVCFFSVDDDTNVTCQAFKGRYGFAGRYFHVVISKRRETSVDGVERLVIGARSIPKELEEMAHDFIDRDDAPELLKEIEKTQVRGFAYVAGLIIERHPSGGKDNGPLIVIAYLNDADIVTSGVPRWIIDRVKLDQLSVVKNVPSVLLAAWRERE